MKLLLDTHATLWWLADDKRFGAAAAAHLEEGANRVLLSAVVTWEVAIKRSLGKLTVREGFVDAVLAAGAQPLPVTLDHAAAVERLPWHHRDPFDRILVAQAMVEKATIVSGDERLARYGVPVVWR